MLVDDADLKANILLTGAAVQINAVACLVSSARCFPISNRAIGQPFPSLLFPKAGRN